MKYDCLIVDDEAALSESTRDYFNMFDVNTAWVADQAACFDFLRENQVSLILLDINLGDSSGFDLCKHLRKTIEVPILFISARTHDLRSARRVNRILYLQDGVIRGECLLGNYTSGDVERQNKLNAFLSEMEW